MPESMRAMSPSIDELKRLVSDPANNVTTRWDGRQYVIIVQPALLVDGPYDRAEQR